MENLYYTGKVWLATVLVAPVVLMIVLAVINAPTTGDMMQSFPLLGAIILYGIVLSIPSFLLSWWLAASVKEMFAKVWVQKLILSAAGAVFIIVTLLIVDSPFFIPLTMQSVLWPGVYILVLAGAVFFFKMEK